MEEKHFYKKHLNSFLVASILLGGVAGYVLPEWGSALKPLGSLFLASLKMLIVPIIAVSLLSGILNVDQESSLARIGLKTLVFYALTTALAVGTGLLLVNVIQPGVSTSPLALPDGLEATPAKGGLLAVVENIIPQNIVQAAASGNVLGVIFFTIFFGVALRGVKGSGLASVQGLVETIFNALIWMVDLVMLVAPLGVLALIWNLVSETIADNLLQELIEQLGVYALTVVLGLGIHAGFTLPIILLLYGVNPLKFHRAMLPAITTAFSTASSAATLPLTIESLTERARVPERFASFVAPLGATVNMDGTAIYEAVAAIFIANMYGIDLEFGEQLIIFLTATFSAIGAAGIPGAGLIMMTMVLASVGIPVEGISLIVAIDRVLDMFRTSVNVWGDSIGAAVIARSEGEEVLK